MKLIGITGKTGSGKTTLSNMIAINENVGVIHVDEIRGKLQNVMQKYDKKDIRRQNFKEYKCSIKEISYDKVKGEKREIDEAR